MTRKITITNTSNWAGEPVYVAAHVLAPGDSLDIAIDPPPNVGENNVDSMLTVRVMALRTAEKSLPFAEIEKPHFQVMPEVGVEWVRSTAEIKGEFQPPPIFGVEMVRCTRPLLKKGKNND